MTVEDQHSWLTPLLRQPPPSALIVWEIDFGGYVASVKAHLGSFPQHRCSGPRHDQPAPSQLGAAFRSPLGWGNPWGMRGERPQRFDKAFALDEVGKMAAVRPFVNGNLRQAVAQPTSIAHIEFAAVYRGTRDRNRRERLVDAVQQFGNRRIEQRCPIAEYELLVGASGLVDEFPRLARNTVELHAVFELLPKSRELGPVQL